MRVYISGGPSARRFDAGTQKQIEEIFRAIDPEIEFGKSGKIDYVVIDDGTSNEGPSATAEKTGGEVIEYSDFLALLKKKAPKKTSKKKDSKKKGSKKESDSKCAETPDSTVSSAKCDVLVSLMQHYVVFLTNIYMLIEAMYCGASTQKFMEMKTKASLQKIVTFEAKNKPNVKQADVERCLELADDYYDALKEAIPYALAKRPIPRKRTFDAYLKAAQIIWPNMERSAFLDTITVFIQDCAKEFAVERPERAYGKLENAIDTLHGFIQGFA